MKNVLVVGAAIIITLAMAGTVMAATATSGFTVSTTVASVCRVSTAASNVTFGNYDPTDATANDTGSGSFGVRCTKGTTYRLYVSGTRSMTAGAETLNFELYSDAGRTTAYPSLFAGASPVSSTSNAEVVSNYYGRIPAAQDVTAGAAFTSGTLNATVEY